MYNLNVSDPFFLCQTVSKSPAFPFCDLFIELSNCFSDLSGSLGSFTLTTGQLKQLCSSNSCALGVFILIKQAVVQQLRQKMRDAESVCCLPQIRLSAHGVLWFVPYLGYWVLIG